MWNEHLLSQTGQFQILVVVQQREQQALVTVALDTKRKTVIKRRIVQAFPGSICNNAGINRYLNTDSLPKLRYLSSAAPPDTSQSLHAKLTASPQLN